MKNMTIQEQIIDLLQVKEKDCEKLFSLPMKINSAIYTIKNYPNNLNNTKLYDYIISLIGKEKDFIDEPGAIFIYKDIVNELNLILK